MALTVQFPSPMTGTTRRLPNTSARSKPPHVSHPSLQLLPKIWPVAISAASLRRKTFTIVRASEESRESAGSESEPEKEAAAASEEELSELGSEIKKAMMEKRKAGEEKEPLSLSGVSREVGEIEWPAFRKVLGITGVVLGVIAGSSIVLLTVNFVLAELSDGVFAGKGVQDFFS